MVKVDRRVEKTQACIRNAFVDMLTEMDYEAITVAELAKRANIDRKTFYLHYKSKDDLLHSLEEEHAQEIRRLLSELEWSSGALPDMGTLQNALAEAFETVAPVHRRVALTPSYAFILIDELRLLQTAFRDVLAECTQLAGDQLELYAEYCAGGLLALYWRWLRTGETTDFGTVVTTAVDATCHGIGRVMKEGCR